MARSRNEWPAGARRWYGIESIAKAKRDGTVQSMAMALQRCPLPRRGTHSIVEAVQGRSYHHGAKQRPDRADKRMAKALNCRALATP